jgi:hypothetical protein
MRVGWPGIKVSFSPCFQDEVEGARTPAILRHWAELPELNAETNSDAAHNRKQT